MKATNEQIIAEAERRSVDSVITLPNHIIEVMRENWTPPEPEPVDPDVLAWREWAAGGWPLHSKTILAGKWDCGGMSNAYLAGARMAREREQKRANPVVAFAVRVMAGVFNDLDHAKREARKAIDEYEGEA